MGDVVAVVQRELRRGKSQREVARQLGVPEQRVRRLVAGTYTPRTPLAIFARCKCGGKVKTNQPCLCCKLRGGDFPGNSSAARSTAGTHR